MESLCTRHRACEIICESFLQSRLSTLSSMTTRSLSPVTGVRPIAFWCTRDEKDGGRTRKRAEGEKTYVRKAEREKTDTEQRWTNGPPRLRAIMSRSRKLAAPSSIMPSSCAITCYPSLSLPSFFPLIILFLPCLLSCDVANWRWRTRGTGCIDHHSQTCNL